jgi:hypothetical protein
MCDSSQPIIQGRGDFATRNVLCNRTPEEKKDQKQVAKITGHDILFPE